MFTLRCTAKLRDRLNAPSETSPVTPSTRLGDWYAHLLFTRPQLVLCVSERTLLPVLVPARDGGGLVQRLREGVGQVLRTLDVPDAVIAAEQSVMSQAIIGKTRSRQVLGSINDFVRMLDWYLGRHRTLLDVSLHLAETPCGPLKGNSPKLETIRVLGTPS